MLVQMLNMEFLDIIYWTWGQQVNGFSHLIFMIKTNLIHGVNNASIVNLRLKDGSTVYYYKWAKPPNIFNR